MTFDMTRCKIGDKLKTREGNVAYFFNLNNHCDYPYMISFHGEEDDYTVDALGNYNTNFAGKESLDIIGFWEEEGELSEDEESFPNIEVRTPHIAKIITYRVHFNEMFHRDMSEQEAVAIYQQLKELLGEK
jgi:hypothetical protein